jgi:hypothetical protein
MEAVKQKPQKGVSSLPGNALFQNKFIILPQKLHKNKNG